MSRKPLAALAASVTVLVAAGVALAHGGGPATTQSVSAAFDATTVSKLTSRTCTGGDGSYTMTKATYTGTATSTDARFAGTVTVKAHTLYNTDTNLGTVDGRFRIESTLAAMQRACALVVVGTSGATTLPTLAVQVAVRRGLPLVVVDPEETSFAALALRHPRGAFARGSASQRVPELVARWAR